MCSCLNDKVLYPCLLSSQSRPMAASPFSRTTSIYSYLMVFIIELQLYLCYFTLFVYDYSMIIFQILLLRKQVHARAGTYNSSPIQRTWTLLNQRTSTSPSKKRHKLYIHVFEERNGSWLENHLSYNFKTSFRCHVKISSSYHCYGWRID